MEKERANNEWAFHLEDLSGRSVLTGVYLGTPDFQNCASEDIYAEFTSNTDSPYYGYTIYGLQNHYLDIQQVYFMILMNIRTYCRILCLHYGMYLIIITGNAMRIARVHLIAKNS